MQRARPANCIGAYLQADALQSHDVDVVELPEDHGLLANVLQRGRGILVGILAGRFHGDHLAPPRASVHFAEAADADHLLEAQLAEVDLDRLVLLVEHVRAPAAAARFFHLLDKVGREDADFVADLPRPPSLVARYLDIAREDLDELSLAQAQLVLPLSVVVVEGLADGQPSLPALAAGAAAVRAAEIQDAQWWLALLLLLLHGVLPQMGLVREG